MISAGNSAQATSGGAYLNIKTEQGGVYAWTCVYQRPTYLLCQSLTVILIQFVDEDWADEWLKEHQNWEIVKRLDKLGG